MATMMGVMYHHLKDAQATADMLLKCVEADLMDWNEPLRIFIVRLEITDDVQVELDCFQYPLPMVVEPNLLTTNKDSGYMLGSLSVILRNNHHEDDVCLDHINRMNAVKFTINNNVVTMIQNKWKSLDKKKQEETVEKFEQRKKAFAKYDRTAKDVMELLTAEGNELYLTHAYDKRGRTYSRGYHVNYQGNTWNKACVEFADKEII